MTGHLKKTALYLAATACLATTTGCQMAQQMGQGFGNASGITEEIQAQEKLYGPQPKTQTNYYGVKYPGRASYLQGYADAKPVAYGGPSLTNYYELAKANQGKELKDEKFTYYFRYSNNGKYLNSCQFDNITFDNTKLLLNKKTGLMEPVFTLQEGSFSLMVDQAATSRLYARHLKTLKLKPLSETMKYGKLFTAQVNAETNRRLAINEKEWKHRDRTQTTSTVTTREMFSELGSIGDKSKNYDAEEFSTIYNIKFKDMLHDDVFKGADFLVVVNKDNYVIDRLPNYLTMRYMNEKVLNERLSKNMHLTGQTTQMETVKMYAHYKYSVKSNLESLEQGQNYANTSVQVFSIERLKGLNATGRTLVPDVKITTTDIPLLDKMLDTDAPGGPTAWKTLEEEQNCSKGAMFGSQYSQQCWDNMKASYPGFWHLNFSKVAQQRNAAINKYDAALDLLDEAKKSMTLTTGLRRTKLGDTAAEGVNGSSVETSGTKASSPADQEPVKANKPSKTKSKKKNKAL